jgi:biotin transport system substrate-specific component
MDRGTRTPDAARADAVALEAGQPRAHAMRPAIAAMALVTAGVGLLAASAWISVPFYPVPLTMQTLAVLMIGGVLGPKLGTASVAGYLVLGLTGAPVFHGGLGGPAIFVGPTGGYLLGFLPAVLLMGLAAKNRWAIAPGRTLPLRRWAALMTGALVAEAAIYVIGVPWLAFVGGLTLREAVAVGAVRGGRRVLGRWGTMSF